MTAWLNDVRNAGHGDHRPTIADDSHSRSLRLAVYGHLNRHCGSSPGSHYMLMDYLLAQGHHIDLYAVGGFVEPDFSNRGRIPGLSFHWPSCLGFGGRAFSENIAVFSRKPLVNNPSSMVLG